MSDATAPEPVKCSKCGIAPAGPGGILCPSCLATIQAQGLPSATSGRDQSAGRIDASSNAVSR